MRTSDKVSPSRDMEYRAFFIHTGGQIAAIEVSYCPSLSTGYKCVYTGIFGWFRDQVPLWDMAELLSWGVPPRHEEQCVTPAKLSLGEPGGSCSPQGCACPSLGKAPSWGPGQDKGSTGAPSTELPSSIPINPPSRVPQFALWTSSLPLPPPLPLPPAHTGTFPFP